MNVVGQDEIREFRILQVFSTLGVGGAETWLMALLRYFDREKDNLSFRIRFDICLTSGNKGVFDDEAVALGARLFYPRYSRNNLLGFIREFRSILAEGKYDAIHDHQDYTSGFHFLFGIGHLPLVRIAHIHTTYIHISNYSVSWLRKFTAATGKYLLAHLSTHIIGTSRMIISEYGFDNGYFDTVHCSVVHCGFDTAEFSNVKLSARDQICNEFGWDQTVKILLFAGRLEPVDNPKNPEFALEIAKKCIEIDPSIRFLMAGAGENIRRIFDERVVGWDLQTSIKIIGVRTDIPKLMSGSDLLLFPSIAEGLGMVAVEAQAAGLRVLASDAVPRECIVINGLVSFKSLDMGAMAWAKTVFEILELSSPDKTTCYQCVRTSPFSIENSAESLSKIYLGEVQ